MSRYSLEVSVGIFVVAGILALSYLSIRLGKMEVIGNSGYEVKAEFSDVGGLRGRDSGRRGRARDGNIP